MNSKVNSVVVNKDKGSNIDAESLYMRELSAEKLLTAEEELKLAKQVKQGNQEARAQMIKANLRLVIKLARKYKVEHLSLLDLIEEGNIGLIRAVEKFDPDKGFRFSTYASWWIRHEIERAIMNQSRTVRLPVHVVRKLNKYKKNSYQLVQELQHEPNMQELADSTENSLDDIGSLMNYNRPMLSMSEPLADSEDGGFTVIDSIKDETSPDPEDCLQEQDVQGQLKQYLDCLPEQTRLILEQRFGLNGYEPATLQEVSEYVGLTRERVRQIQIQAIGKLKSIMQQNGCQWQDFA